jgi:hypothetical protein
MKKKKKAAPNHPVWISPPSGVAKLNVDAKVTRNKETCVVATVA